MIKILAPSRNYEITKMQLEAGADEIYLGVDAGDFNVYSFGGRFKTMNSVKTQLNNYDELKKCCKICKEKNAILQVTANMHYIPAEFEEGYLQHIQSCIESGADQIIVSNVGLIKKIWKINKDIDLVAGSFTFIPNSECIKFLYDLGVQRVVLPHATTLKEIEMIKKAVPDIEIEIFALIGGGNNCGRCMMFHSPIREDIGPGCRASYSVEYNNKNFEEICFMDAAADCSLCSMRELENAGVTSLKIVGRETKNEIVATLFTEVFFKYRECMYSGMKATEIKKYLSDNQFGWEMIWKKRFCDKARCKFHSTEITRSYITLK